MSIYADAYLAVRASIIDDIADAKGIECYFPGDGEDPPNVETYLAASILWDTREAIEIGFRQFEYRGRIEVGVFSRTKAGPASAYAVADTATEALNPPGVGWDRTLSDSSAVTIGAGGIVFTGTDRGRQLITLSFPLIAQECK